MPVPTRRAEGQQEHSAATSFGGWSQHCDDIALVSLANCLRKAFWGDHYQTAGWPDWVKGNCFLCWLEVEPPPS